MPTKPRLATDKMSLDVTICGVSLAKKGLSAGLKIPRSALSPQQAVDLFAFKHLRISLTPDAEQCYLPGCEPQKLNCDVETGSLLIGLDSYSVQLAVHKEDHQAVIAAAWAPAELTFEVIGASSRVQADDGEADEADAEAA